MESYITIGEIIRHYRKEKGLSQEELSQGICDRKYLSHIENNRNIPTLGIINQLSNRLEVNLYDTYALMLRHYDIDTHKKIEELNQLIRDNKYPKIKDFIEKNKDSLSFQRGEPLQQLKYAEALYLSSYERQDEKSIAIALEALSINNSFSIDNLQNTRYFSNVELTLLNLIGVEYCRINEKELGKKYFNFLQNYMHQLFAQSHYITNKNNLFEIKLLSSLTCNYFLFFKDEYDFLPESIDKALELLKFLHCHHMLPELLLCKTYLLLRSNEPVSAQSTYQLAHYLGGYLYEPARQNSNEKYILGDYLSQLISE